MRRTISTPTLAAAGIGLAVAWLVFSPNAPSQAPNSKPNLQASTAATQVGRVAFDSLSPFSEMSGSGAGKAAATANTSDAYRNFAQFALQYRAPGLLPDEKTHIKNYLRELNRDPSARALIVDSFFSAQDAELRESVFSLIRDAKLKDVALLEALIARDKTQPTATSRTNIMDLIADLSTRQDAPYSPAIESFLAQATLHADAAVQSAAAAQHIWYVAQHQPDNIGSLTKYLLQGSPSVREEMYGLLESRMAQQMVPKEPALLTSLNTVIHTPGMDLSAEERTRATALLQLLSSHGG